jgi:hypothetical protein
MSFLRGLVVISGALALAACGSNSSGDDASTPDSHTGGSPDAHSGPDATPAPDAMPSAYACVGQSFPTTAPDPLTVMGITKEINQNGQVVLGGVMVTAFNSSNNMLGTPQTSDATTGAYTLSVTSGGNPIDGYLHGTKTGQTAYKDTYIYPNAPLAVNQGYVPVLMVSNLTWAFLPALSHGASQPAGSGFMGVEVVDCTGKPVAGATVTADSGTVRYVMGTGIGDPAAGATSTDVSGIALIFDVTPGTAVNVSGSGGGHTFLQHAVNVRADVVTTTVLAPGPIPGLMP